VFICIFEILVIHLRFNGYHEIDVSKNIAQL
jgi:hypothetical protein